MRKPDINIVTETFIKLIEPCLPSVFVEPRGGE